MGGLPRCYDPRRRRTAQEDEMLMLLILGCADFVGTDYRKGWTEVECETATTDARGVLHVDVDGDAPRPVSAWTSLVDGEWTESGSIWNDGVDIVTGVPDTEVGCRLWIAE
jgi:hypothetical protein